MGNKLVPFLFNNNAFCDNRGEFRKIFDSTYLANELMASVFQVNLSTTYEKGTVRGMHCQIGEFSEAKIVTVLKGTIYDVCIKNKPIADRVFEKNTFELSENTKKSLYIPEGYSHGFQALTDDVQILYLHSKDYAPLNEGGFNPIDPILDIKWPLEVKNLSEKDKSLPFL